MERLYDWFPLLSARLTTAFSKLLTCILPNLRQKNCYPGSAGIKSASFTVILVHCFYFLFSSWRTPFPLPVILESRLFSHCHPGARFFFHRHPGTSLYPLLSFWSAVLLFTVIMEPALSFTVILEDAAGGRRISGRGGLPPGY